MRHSPEFLDHFSDPKNVGLIQNADAMGMVSNPACGDTTKLSLRIESGVITDARWLTKGCSASIAASSAVSELVRGLSLKEARTINKQSIAMALGGLPQAKSHSTVLAIDALMQALDDFDSKHQG